METIVRENHLKHDCLFNLSKRLFTTGNSKALISAARICCRFSGWIPSKNINDIAKMLTECTTHKSVVVRSETATALGEVLVEGSLLEPTALAGLKRLVKDPQNTVHVNAFQSLCSGNHSKMYFSTVVLPLIMSCLEVRNWRIRYVFVRQSQSIMALLDSKQRKPVVAMLSKCLSDTESEVAVLALQNLKNLTGILEPEEFIEKLLPELSKVINSESLEMKRALAATAGYLSPLLIKHSDSFGQLRTLITSLAKDSVPEIRLALLQNIEPYLRASVSPSTSQAFMAQLTEFLNDKNWKHRAVSLRILETLMLSFPDDFPADEKTARMFQEKLADRIANVRKTAVIVLKNLSVSLGTGWTEKYSLPLIAGFSDNNNYLYRINYPLGLSVVFHILSPAVLTKQIEVLSALVRDAVPSIRFQSLMALLCVAQGSDDKAIEERLRRIAEAVQGDNDPEVRRLAKAIIQSKDVKAVVEKNEVLNIS